MKKILIFIFSLSFFLSGCDDDPGRYDQIYGKWKWVESTGGIAGVHQTPDTEGYTMFLQFNRDGTYQRMVADTIQSQGEFLITDGSNMTSSHTMPMIHYENETMLQIISELSRDSLVLDDNCIDCFRVRYIKVGPDTQ